MEYLALFFTISAVLVQQALGSPGFSLFHPLHHGPHALPVVQHNGFLADTHEVTAARNAHLAAVAAHGHHEYPAHHHEYPVNHIDLPVRKEHSVHHQLPVHHQELPVHHQELPVHHQELPVHHQELPVHHQELPVHHQELPVHHQELPVHHQELPVHHQELSAHHGSYGHEYTQKYHGPIAVPVVLHNGHLADTPEVALTTSHHLGAVAQAKADKYYNGHQEYGYGGSYGYSGSHHGYGIPVVLPNGYIADTHEVAAAKSALLLAVAKAKADKYYSGQGEGYGYGGGYGYSGSYHGYGIPVVLPNGHLADTHEVAAAKAAHLSAVAHAKAEQAHSYYHYDEHDHHEHDHHEHEHHDHHEHEHHENEHHEHEHHQHDHHKHEHHQHDHHEHDHHEHEHHEHEHHELPQTYYVPHHTTHVPQVAYIGHAAQYSSHAQPQSFANVRLVE